MKHTLSKMGLNFLFCCWSHNEMYNDWGNVDIIMLADLRDRNVKKRRRVENLTKSAIMFYFKLPNLSLRCRGEFQSWRDSPAQCEGQ